jgi:hypothetical protein
VNRRNRDLLHGSEVFGAPPPRELDLPSGAPTHTGIEPLHGHPRPSRCKFCSLHQRLIGLVRILGAAHDGLFDAGDDLAGRVELRICS